VPVDEKLTAFVELEAAIRRSWVLSDCRKAYPKRFS